VLSFAPKEHRFKVRLPKVAGRADDAFFNVVAVPAVKAAVLKVPLNPQHGQLTAIVGAHLVPQLADPPCGFSVG
jgi:hypothetical protein